MPDERTRPDRTIKLTLAYDGTPFVGWQRQAVGTSIQGLLEEALARLNGAPVSVVGAGRTDAGVHASSQVASAQLTTTLDPPVIRRALNALLPAEIRVLEVLDVPSSFHARYSALSKTYRYHIVSGGVVSPFEWRYSWHVPEPLDLEAMAAAAFIFEGEHDFAAFRATGSSVKTSRRRVTRSCVERVIAGSPTPWGAFVRARGDATTLVYEICATGFLRHMVRTIAGTLVEVGLGRRTAGSIAEALLSGDRAAAGVTAPACGLCLVGVEY